MRAKVDGDGYEAGFRHVETHGPESFRDTCVTPIIGRRQDPWFSNQLGEIDLAPASPSAARIGGHDQLVVEQDFHIEIRFIAERAHRTRHDEIVLAIA